MRRYAVLIMSLTLAVGGSVSTSALAQNYQGNWSANKYAPNSFSNPYQRYNNPYGTSQNSPKAYDSNGNFRGNLNTNRYDPNSIANPYGRYGSRFSPDSANNPYGAGSRFRSDSPNNPYGRGWRVYD